MTVENSSQFMKRALYLARLGAGKVAPNPMVGCVIVHEGKIIGEGFHQKYGEAHAEVNAINSVIDKSLLSASTVYVTLEPCAHFGKTPPCADLLVKHQVKKVVICNVDSNPLVGGKGIEKLKNVGIEVETGLLAAEGRQLNKRFFTYIEKKRPYLILKWAQTADGFIAKANFDAIQISGALSRRFVHKMRSEESAIMVGTNTARFDNPSLNIRFWTGKNPMRVVIDKQLSLLPNAKILDDNQPTICYNLLENKVLGNTIYVKLNPSLGFVEQIIAHLYQKNIQSILIEGGTILLQHFIEAGLWDEAIVLSSPTLLETGIKAPNIAGNKQIVEMLGEDEIQVIYRLPLSVQ
jgi:diaminohydroxyphosphoribosylaminopyrimidine deaminase/5-amino-6-(5-phosphoribosylamino)uracil reductase